MGTGARRSYEATWLGLPVKQLSLVTVREQFDTIRARCAKIISAYPAKFRTDTGIPATIDL